MPRPNPAVRPLWKCASRKATFQRVRTGADTPVHHGTTRAAASTTASVTTTIATAKLTRSRSPVTKVHDHAAEILADFDLRVVRSLAHTRMLAAVFAMLRNTVFQGKPRLFGTNLERRLSTVL